MQAYLDNSATTRCSERARDIMVKVLMEDYGNPSSLHTMGMVAEGYIRRAKEQIAKTLKAEEKKSILHQVEPNPTIWRSLERHLPINVQETISLRLRSNMLRYRLLWHI